MWNIFSKDSDISKCFSTIVALKLIHNVMTLLPGEKDSQKNGIWKIILTVVFKVIGSTERHSDTPLIKCLSF